MVVSKFRFRFRKAGDLRFLSHHDLMRVFERMLRRAELPFRSTEGFHPKPKMAFASALALGVVGHEEVLEIEFDGELAPDDVLQRLRAQAPLGLELLSVKAIEPRTKAHVRAVTYGIQLDRDRTTELAARARALLGQQHCWVERSHPQPRRVDIRLYLKGFQVSFAELSMTFHVTPQGTARPEEVLELLGLTHLLDRGGVLERTALELDDEPSSAHDPGLTIICYSGGGGDDEPDHQPAELAPSEGIPNA